MSRPLLKRSQLWQLSLTRVREFLREPEAVFWTFFFPIVIALALGIAFSGGEPGPIAVGVERGAVEEVVFRALDEAPDIEADWLEPGQALRALRDGTVYLVVGSDPQGLTYRYDPTRSESRTARLAADDAIQQAAGRRDVRAVTEERVTTHGSRYIDFLIPGLIGLNLLSTGMWGVGYRIVSMRTGKLMKRFMATPMSRPAFLLSFMLGRMIFLGPELALILVFAWLAFDVTIAGSTAAVIGISVLGAFSFTGLGLLVASRARTTEGVSGIMNVVAMPMWILSGVFFSYEHFPDAMQPLIHALPLTPLLDALRAVMNDGLGLLDVAGELGLVAVWGGASFAVAAAIFRWK